MVTLYLEGMRKQMEFIRIIKDFQPVNDEKLLSRAAELAPVLNHKTVEAEKCFLMDGQGCRKQESITLAEASQSCLRKGQSLCFDFGCHLVGYVALDLSYTGSHPDAPAFLKLNFVETFKELGMRSEDYHGWVSGSWIQKEYIHVDELPGQIKLPRRYAFRYLKNHSAGDFTEISADSEPCGVHDGDFRRSQLLGQLLCG